MDDSSRAPDSGRLERDAPGQSAASPDEIERGWISSVAKGDEQAFVQIYRRHAQAVFNYLLRLIHDESLAEDLLQDTFVAVWQGASSYRGRSRVKTWILRIAHNRAVSWLRRSRPASVASEPEVTSQEPGPEKLAITDWQNEEILDALEALTPNHRAVVELVFVHEQSYAEIAAIMDCPVGTVKSRMSYALRHLNRLLRQAGLEG